MNTGFWRNFTCKKFAINILWCILFFSGSIIADCLVDKINIVQSFTHKVIIVLISKAIFFAFWYTIWNEKKEHKINKQND